MLGPELNDGLHLDVIMALIVTLLAFLVSGCFKVLPPDGGSQAVFSGPRPYNAEDVAVAQGYRIEIMATGLTFPTGVTFDREGIPYVVESGYSYGEVWDQPRLLQIGEQGRVTQIAEGENNGPWTGVSYYNDAFYVAEGGTL